MIVDTSALLCFFDRSEPRHDEMANRFAAQSDELVVSPYVIAELDYLISTRIGVEAELAALAELASGAWTLAGMDADGLTAAATIIARYSDQAVGVADASNVVLAARFRTRTIATLDRRHFEVLRPLTGGRFRLVP